SCSEVTVVSPCCVVPGTAGRPDGKPRRFQISIAHLQAYRCHPSRIEHILRPYQQPLSTGKNYSNYFSGGVGFGGVLSVVATSVYGMDHTGTTTTTAQSRAMMSRPQHRQPDHPTGP